ncbi:hypothetical protein [Actinacidiphila yanglinensis]|uniref:hypothetical protein n=1 Tax=Actinacidiphila yanglinensis TaxID=310779 RepID=UPI001F327191|nr:hypothetical protein [Actinacidiphila yanglinensis]
MADLPALVGLAVLVGFSGSAGPALPERGHHAASVRRGAGAGPAAVVRLRPDPDLAGDFTARFAVPPDFAPLADFALPPGFALAVDRGAAAGFFGVALGLAPALAPALAAGAALALDAGFGAAFRGVVGSVAPLLDPEDGSARKRGTRSAMDRGPLELGTVPAPLTRDRPPYAVGRRTTAGRLSDR